MQMSHFSSCRNQTVTIITKTTVRIESITTDGLFRTVPLSSAQGNQYIDLHPDEYEFDLIVVSIAWVQRTGTCRISQLCNSKATWSLKLNEMAYLTTNMTDDVLASSRYSQVLKT